MEDITNSDYKHAKREWNNFKIKNLGNYHDSYVQRGTLLLADVFESFAINILYYMSLIQLTFFQHKY